MRDNDSSSIHGNNNYKEMSTMTQTTFKKPTTTMRLLVAIANDTSAPRLETVGGLTVMLQQLLEHKLVTTRISRSGKHHYIRVYVTQRGREVVAQLQG